MYSKQPNEKTLQVYKDIFNFTDPHEKINKLRKKIVQDTWGFAINYISEITSGRFTRPIEYVYPDTIRCDMHNIPDRLTLYLINRSTKLSSFHGSGCIDKNLDINVNFRIVLTTNNYIPVMGKVLGADYTNQPFCYLAPVFAKKFKGFNKFLINSLKTK